MRLSELTNEMLSAYKYPNLMAEVKGVNLFYLYDC